MTQLSKVGAGGTAVIDPDEPLGDAANGFSFSAFAASGVASVNRLVSRGLLTLVSRTA